MRERQVEELSVVGVDVDVVVVDVCPCVQLPGRDGATIFGGRGGDGESVTKQDARLPGLQHLKRTSEKSGSVVGEMRDPRPVRGSCARTPRRRRRHRLPTSCNTFSSHS